MDRQTIRVTIAETRLSELRMLTEKHFEGPDLVAIKDFKAQSMPSVLHVWRPFVQMLYAALTGQPAVLGCVWLQQVRFPMTWIGAFLLGHAGVMVDTPTAEAWTSAPSRMPPHTALWAS